MKMLRMIGAPVVFLAFAPAPIAVNMAEATPQYFTLSSPAGMGAVYRRKKLSQCDNL
jgi:hypothetical protein